MSKNMKKGLSRRDFLKGAAASALGVAAFGVMGHNEAVAEESAQIAAAKYEVINTDLLIIGGGFGAMSAAYEALAKGQRVTIVDKGPYGHSGNAGFNWDAIATWQTEGNEGQNPDWALSSTRSCTTMRRSPARIPTRTSRRRSSTAARRSPPALRTAASIGT